MKECYIDCDCHSELIRIEIQDDGEYWFSFWQEGFCSKEKYTFKEKLRLIWTIFTNGKPYTDMLIFNREKINKMVDFLKEDK